MNFFDGNGISATSSNEVKTLKKQLKALQEQTDALSVALVDLENTVSSNKALSEQTDASLGESIGINRNDIESLETNLSNYKRDQAEITEVQVLRATEYIESPLHRFVETETILENQVFGNELKTKKVIINYKCTGKKYIDIKKIPKGIISFNNGALKLLVDTVYTTAAGFSVIHITEIDNNLLSPGVYQTNFNSVFLYEMQEFVTVYNCLYFIMQNYRSFPLIIDYVITENINYSREQFLATLTESDEPIHESTSSFATIENGYHNLHGYIFDKNGKIDTDVHTSDETGNILTSSGTSQLATYSLDYLTKGDTHTIGGKFSTLSTVPSGTYFYGSLTKLAFKAVSEILQDLDLYIPIFNYNGVVQAYLHIETPSGISGDVVSYKATILGSLGSQETFYIGQTTFLA